MTSQQRISESEPGENALSGKNGEKPVYLFLTNEIGNVGGGQLYIVRKMDYLRRHGWRVEVAYFVKSRLMIDALRPFKENYIEEMQVHYCVNTKRSRRRGIDKLCRIIGEAPSVIIESYSTPAAMWGEELARIYADKLSPQNVRHLLYLITENPRFTNIYDAALAIFKLNEWQVRSISSIGLAELINGLLREQRTRGLPLPDFTDYELAAGNSPGSCRDGQLAEFRHPQLEDVPTGRYTILVISRFDKPYIEPIFRDIARFTGRHPDESFEVITIGAATSARRTRQLLRILQRCPGLTLRHLGFTYPMPLEALRRADVAIGNAGSVMLTSGEGVPSIVVDSRDFKGIGIYGESTQNVVHRGADEPPIDSVELLEEVYSHRHERRLLRVSDPVDYPAPDFSEHLQWLEESSNKVFPQPNFMGPITSKDKFFHKIIGIRCGKLITLLKNLKSRLGL